VDITRLVARGNPIGRLRPLSAKSCRSSLPGGQPISILGRSVQPISGTVQPYISLSA